MKKPSLNPHHSEDPYKTLNLEYGATEAEIKQAYFALVREHSPEQDPEGFKRIRAAYEKLRSISDRAETDLFMVAEKEAAFDPSTLQKHADEPPQITTDFIKQDLLALEAFLLVEELTPSR